MPRSSLAATIGSLHGCVDDGPPNHIATAILWPVCWESQPSVGEVERIGVKRLALGGDP
jgi:hypothetical protein